MLTQEWGDMAKARDDLEARAAAMAKRVREEFVLPEGPLDAWGWEWLADVVARETRSEVEVVDCGYDVSSYGRRRKAPFRIADFDTVADFLQEPTGQTQATYESGSGMRAEDYEEVFLQDAHEQICDWVVRHGYMEGLSEMERDQAWDALGDALVEADAWEGWWAERFGKEPFAKIAQFPRLRSV